MSPSTPGGHCAASASSSSNEAPPVTSRSQRSDPAADRITPIANQRSGAAWHDACRRPPGSAAYAGSALSTTPEVPSTTDTGPGRTAPTPTAPAPWSPAPAATGTPAGVAPVTATDSSTRGSHDRVDARARRARDRSSERDATSNHSVPEASVTSVADSPHSRSRT